MRGKSKPQRRVVPGTCGRFPYRCAIGPCLALWALAAGVGAQGWNVERVGSYDTPGNSWDVRVTENLAFIADRESGLHIIDVSDPSAPALLSTYDTPSLARAVYVTGGVAYVADAGSGIQIIDVSDPSQPSHLVTCSLPDDEEDVYVVGDLAYVAGGYQGLHIVDVTDPSRPLHLATCDTPGDGDGVYVAGDLAYFVSGGPSGAGLYVIDVRNSSAPVLLGAYGTEGYARDVYASGGLAYVANGPDGLRIFDVSDPSSPTLRGLFDTPGYSMGVCVAHGLAYVADGYSGLWVLNVVDPTSPTLRAHYPTSSAAFSVVVSEGLIYVAAWEDGLLVLRLTDPPGPRQLYVDDDAPNDPGPGDPTVSDPAEDGTPAHPFDAIQKAIDVATSGDSVVVLDGRYTGAGNRDIEFGGKAIIVRSQNGPANCIVDCQYASLEEMHRGFYFRSGEDNRSVLEGLTITNGFQGDGGAIRCEGASPVIRNNVITGNTAEYDGDGGGGISCFYGGSPRITHNVITGNDGGVGGGGIRCYKADAPLIATNVIEENVAGWGGGIVCDWCDSATILSNTITSNTAKYGGGGGVSTWGAASIVNNLIATNTSTGPGGGILCGEVSTPVLANNTIAGNIAVHGGGIAATYGASPIMTNCILWGNAADWGPEMSLHYASNYGPVFLTVRHCDVAGGPAPAYVESFCTLDWDGSNLTDDPLFVGPASGNYHLSGHSPCIDAGNNAAVPPSVLTDLDGNPRFFDDPHTSDTGHGSPPIVDMGACEFRAVPPPSRLYVDEHATGTNNGTSWADAFNDLQDALELAARWPDVVQEIWVAEGTYKPSAQTDPADLRTATFQLVDGVAVYGGFAGIETELGQRDPAANETILSGDLNGDDGTGPHRDNAENSYHVVTAVDVGPTTRLDGFTITAGNADGPWDPGHTYGGGMTGRNINLKIADCTFTGNCAGGGSGLYHENGSPTLIGCVFQGNVAQYGGALSGRDSDAIIVNCTFLDNSGGGACAGGTFYNCRFNGNTADLEGGALGTAMSDLTLINCTFHGNRSLMGGGAIFLGVEVDAVICNCILWGNSAPVGPQIYIGNSHGETALTVTHSDIEGSSSGIYAQDWYDHTLLWGPGNIEADPAFVAPGHWDDAASPGDPEDDLWMDGNYFLQGDSPCIDAGYSGPFPAAVTTDLAGNPRFFDDPNTSDTGNGPPPIVDMGAYEFQGLKIIYVDRDATGADNGTSWADAFNDLQDALALAASVGGMAVEIWVAEGAYTPSAQTDPGDPRSATFQLLNGVAVYGGFAAVETERDQRDNAANETILSGDLAGDDGPDFANNEENSYHVVTGSGTHDTAVLDGFTITAGNAADEPDPGGWGPGGCGGGMRNDSGNPTVTYCTFRGNAAVRGGAMWGGRPTVSHCRFIGNRARWGGGIYGPGASHCTFVGNTAEVHAGAMVNEWEWGGPVINCAFIGNTAGWAAGAVWNWENSAFYLNCLFTGNVADDGGAVWNVDSTGYTFINCTFSSNTARGEAGGIDSDYYPALFNCIFWGNRDGGGVSEDSQVKGYTPVGSAFVHNCIQGWTGALGGTGNHGLNPLFMDGDGPDGIVGTEDDNVRLLPGSPCMNAGDNAALPPDTFDLDGDGDRSEPIPIDLEDNPRVLYDIVDMGAYECTEPAQLPATICLHPRTLNRKSKGVWVTCFIELSQGYDVRDIDIASLRLNGTVSAAPHPTAIDDHNDNGIADRMVKFPRDEVIAAVEVGANIVVTVTGQVAGTDFQGTDVIRVIDPGIGPQWASPGRPLEFPVSILVGGLNGRITYRGENLPAGALLDAGTGWFRWTPTPDQIGVYENVTFIAASNSDEVIEVIPITVESPAAPGQTALQGWNVDLVGQVGGDCRGIDVEGNLAYVTEGPSLTIMDVTDPAAPVVVSRTPQRHLLSRVFVEGAVAYLTWLNDQPDFDAGMHILDVSDPTAPKHVCDYQMPDNTLHIWMVGHTAFIALEGSSYPGGYLRIVDFSDPSSPATLATVDTYDTVTDVCVVGNLAYVTRVQRGLLILDITDLSMPAVVGSVQTGDYARAVSVEGSLAFVANDALGLLVVDVRDSSHPVVVGTFTSRFMERFANVQAAGGLVYVATNNDDLTRGSLYVLDVSDPTSPTTVGTYLDWPWDERHPIDLAVANGTVYATAGSNGLRIIDVRDPGRPAPLTVYNPPDDATGAEVVGDLAYTAGNLEGLYFIDVSDPSLPQIRNAYNPEEGGHGVHDVCTSGGLAFTTDHYNSVKILDVADLSAPTILGSYDENIWPRHLQVRGNVVYVACYFSGFLTLDVSDPAHPTRLGFCDTPRGFDLHVAGDTAYVADNSYGLSTVSVLDPANPELTSVYRTPQQAHAVTTSGSLAYVADWQVGLLVVDMSDPSSPTLLSVGKTADKPLDVCLSGNLAYVADRESGLQVFDVSDPASPTLTGSYNTVGSAVRVSVVGNLVYLSHRDTGLWVLRYPASGPGPVAAVLDVKPDTLNRKSRGVGVTCYIELPAGYDVDDIDTASLLLNDTVAASPGPTATGDYDADGIPDLMVKFPRDELIAIVDVGESVEITITGKVAGTDFRAADRIRVIEPGVGNQKGSPGRLLAFSVACLAEGLTGPVTYSGENLPAGATLDPETGLFRWTPTPDQLGVYANVVFGASNGEEDIVDIVMIAVERTTGVAMRTWRHYR